MKRPPAVRFVVPAACAIALAAGAATHDTDGGSAVPDDTTLEAAGAVIGKIEIDAGPIFDTDDPKENKAVFRVANKLHVTTREGVIRRQLSFAEGDPYSRRALDESERHLRHNGYLYDAKIRPVHYDGHTVDVVVTTRDVWTLRPGAGFGRSGGVNRYHFGLHDANFLGFGKDVEIEYVSGIDRSGTQLSYLDPALAHTHARFEVSYADNSDGSWAVLGVDRPFWRIRERWSTGVHGEAGERVDPLYALGAVTSQFREQRTFAEAYVGRAISTSAQRAIRILGGATLDKSIFDPLEEPGATTVLPDDRILAYPWVGVEVVHDGYVKAKDMDKLGRTEDLNLARDFRARLGFVSPTFGADRTAAIGSLSWTAGFSPGVAQIVTLSAGASGRYASTFGLEDALVQGAMRYYKREGDRRLFVVALTGNLADNLDADHQVLLGGDNGLRGYPLRYQSGTRRALFTVEERFYTDLYVWQLFRVGGAAFFDAGRAWGGDNVNQLNPGWLRNAGFGLRIVSARSAFSNVLHVDVAFPLDATPDIKKIQFLVKTRTSF
jgi:hypothetical protein